MSLQCEVFDAQRCVNTRTGSHIIVFHRVCNYGSTRSQRHFSFLGDQYFQGACPIARELIIMNRRLPEFEAARAGWDLEPFAMQSFSPMS